MCKIFFYHFLSSSAFLYQQTCSCILINILNENVEKVLGLTCVTVIKYIEIFNKYYY